MIGWLGSVSFGKSHLVDLGLLQDTHSEATRFEVFPNTKFVMHQDRHKECTIRDKIRSEPDAVAAK
jgi:hypothetical protein